MRARGSRPKEEEVFFFEKKNQKTFAPLRACVPTTARPDDEAGLGQRSLNRAAPT
jgi:hypothetical protein